MPLVKTCPWTLESPPAENGWRTFFLIIWQSFCLVFVALVRPSDFLTLLAWYRRNAHMRSRGSILLMLTPFLISFWLNPIDTLRLRCKKKSTVLSGARDLHLLATWPVCQWPKLPFWKCSASRISYRWVSLMERCKYVIDSMSYCFRRVHFGLRRFYRRHRTCLFSSMAANDSPLNSASPVTWNDMEIGLHVGRLSHPEQHHGHPVAVRHQHGPQSLDGSTDFPTRTIPGPIHRSGQRLQTGLLDAIPNRWLLPWRWASRSSETGKLIRCHSSWKRQKVNGVTRRPNFIRFRLMWRSSACFNRWPLCLLAGRRMCIGDELGRTIIFLFTATVLQQFRLSFPQGFRYDWDQKPEYGFTLVPRPYRIAAQVRQWTKNKSVIESSKCIFKWQYTPKPSPAVCTDGFNLARFQLCLEPWRSVHSICYDNLSLWKLVVHLFCHLVSCRGLWLAASAHDHCAAIDWNSIVEGRSVFFPLRFFASTVGG